MKLDLQISKYIRGFKSNLIPKGKNKQTNNNKTVVECWRFACKGDVSVISTGETGDAKRRNMIACKHVFLLRIRAPKENRDTWNIKLELVHALVSLLVWACVFLSSLSECPAQIGITPLSTIKYGSGRNL